jgi:hypothetical protein
MFAGWALGWATGLFLFGLFLTTGENDHVYWEVRGPLWGAAAVLLVVSLVLYAVAEKGDTER